MFITKGDIFKVKTTNVYNRQLTNRDGEWVSDLKIENTINVN